MNTPGKSTTNGHNNSGDYSNKPELEGQDCPVTVQVEDDRTGMTVETLHRAFADNLYYIQGKNELTATAYDYYMALSYSICRPSTSHCS